MDYLPFSFLKRVCPNLILYSFQQIIYLKYLRIEVDLVNVLFVVFGIYTLNGKVQPNLLQVKTSDFIEFLENEETPQDNCLFRFFRDYNNYNSSTSLS